MGKRYEELIVRIPNYPKAGVVFQDIMPVLGDAEAFAAIVDDIAGHFAGTGITKVMGAEARGFMVGSAVAYKLGAGFVPARKPGKLPRPTITEAYDLEYGTSALEVHADALDRTDIVLIADDLVATGGTAMAMARLVERTGAELAGFGFFIELATFDPRAAIATVTDAEVLSLVTIE